MRWIPIERFGSEQKGSGRNGNDRSLSERLEIDVKYPDSNGNDRKVGLEPKGWEPNGKSQI